MGALGGQRLQRGGLRVVDRQGVAGFEQAFGDGSAHAADTYETKMLFRRLAVV